MKEDRRPDSADLSNEEKAHARKRISVPEEEPEHSYTVSVLSKRQGGNFDYVAYA